jgi:hypothetical protein
MNNDKFPTTTDGCIAALQYLKSVQKDSFILKCEGWDMISFANRVWEKRNNAE